MSEIRAKLDEDLRRMRAKAKAAEEESKLEWVNPYAPPEKENMFAIKQPIQPTKQSLHLPKSEPRHIEAIEEEPQEPQRQLPLSSLKSRHPFGLTYVYWIHGFLSRLYLALTKPFRHKFNIYCPIIDNCDFNEMGTCEGCIYFAKTEKSAMKLQPKCFTPSDNL